FKASGKLDGDADREAAISLDLNFDPNTLLSVEQVGASASLKSLSLKGLLDPAIFGDTLTEATITFENFAPEHTELPGRTLLKISGAVLPPGAEQPVEARVDIWFGGHGGGAAAPFAPSGIGASVQNVPLDPLLKQLGAEGMPKIRPGARISLGTSDAAGSFDTPQAALTWHDGVRVHVRAVIDNLAFAQPKGGTVGGLPADSLASALNRLMTAMKNRLEVQVGFVGAPGEFELALERPGLRNVLDAAIGVLELNGQEMNAEFDLPFTIDVKATATCASVDAEGRPRGIEGEPSSSLADLRLRVSLAKAYAVKKKGHEKILGVPADYFTFAWNMLVAKLPDETIDLTIRLVDEKGRFSPTLVGPDGKQLLKLLGDAVGIDIFEKNFEQLKQKFDAEFKEFQKGGISKAEELGTKLAKGERIKPEEIIPDLPKLPEKPPIKLPKKPPIKLPKFP
ncbi:MAG: hypothetical protein OEY28_12000, partial [Nitrospira sp.]|nr:hypothetical protein [Nitrospira sp.]